MSRVLEQLVANEKRRLGRTSRVCLSLTIVLLIDVHLCVLISSSTGFFEVAGTRGFY